MSWQRARSDEQKAERIRDIENAAGELFLSRRYHEIGLADIAKIAGFTRPNLYRYFSTKEEIFLALLSRDMDAWLAQIEEAPSTGGDVDAFADWWVRAFTAQPRLPRLLPLLSVSLEENSSEDSLRRFKLRLAEQSEHIGRIAARHLPWYPADRLGEFPTVQLALVTGITSMATRGEVLERVLQAPELRGFALEFAETYTTTLATWLRGIRASIADITGADVIPEEENR